MTTRQERSATESHRRTVRRYWRRKEPPVGWWPWGLLLPLALLLLWAYGATRTASQIQSDVGVHVSENLETNGYASSALKVDGQRVEVDVVAHKTEKTRAHETASATKCNTWAGRLVCPSIVALNVLEPARFHDFQFGQADTAIVLTGEVPSDADRERLERKAAEHFTTVDNQLQVTDKTATEQWLPATERALSVLPLLKEGNASWQKGVFSVAGVVEGANEVSARDLIDAPAGNMVLGESLLEVETATEHHNFAFRRTDAGIVLSGDVPSDAERERLGRKAAEHFTTVDNQLQVTDKIATAQWLPATERALSVLPLLREGNASWKEGVFGIIGVIDEANEATARALIDAPAGEMMPVESQLEVVAAPEQHDFAFSHTDTGIVLSGDVPSDADRARLERKAAEHFTTVDNQLQVTDKTPTEQWLPATERALSVLSLLEQGNASWEGGVFGVVGVVDESNEVSARALIDAPAGEMTLGESQLEIEVTLEHHNFAFSHADAEIVLSGDVPSEAERERLEREAAEHFTRVDNQLQVTDKTPTEQWPIATERAMRVLPVLQRGTASWQDGVFSTAGMVEASKEASVRDLIDAPAGEMMVGESQLEIVIAAEHHNFAFSRADVGIVLSGDAPSEAERERLEREAAEHFRSVDNQLQVTDKTPTEQWSMATERAMHVLPYLKKGTASWQGGVFSVVGLVDAENEFPVRERFSAPAGTLLLGDAQLEVVPKPLHHRFRFNVNESGIELAGEAPTLEERDRLRREAAKHFARVENGLRVTGKEATPQWTSAIERAFALLPLIDEGTMQWEEGAFSVRATVDTVNEAQLREQLTLLPQAIALGDVNLQVLSAPQYHDFGFISDGSLIVLEGDVPTTEHRELVLATAAKRFTTVKDELQVTDKTATAQWSVAAERAMRVLPMLESGKAHWEAGVFFVEGVVSDANETTVRQQFRMPVDTITLGNATLQVMRTVETCQEHLSEALQSTTMHFATGTAVIGAESEELLKRLAALAGECPGRLMIEGHTDNVGSQEDNKELSMERAHAVHSALTSLGVDESRLTAFGFGPDRPVASNGTAEGRARNRRIAIKLADDAAAE